MVALSKCLLPFITESLALNSDAIIGLKNGCELQLLSRVLSLIMSTTEIRFLGQDGEETVSSGVEYTEFVLKRMLHVKWSKLMLTKMVSIMREIKLGKPQLEEFLSKVLNLMKGAYPEDLPSLGYQLLSFLPRVFTRRPFSKGHLNYLKFYPGVSGKNGVREKFGIMNCFHLTSLFIFTSCLTWYPI